MHCLHEMSTDFLGRRHSPIPRPHPYSFPRSKNLDSPLLLCGRPIKGPEFELVPRTLRRQKTALYLARFDGELYLVH